MDRLTTDNPKTNTETLLNYAFDKENKVYLRESEEGLELCEYVAGLCSGHAGGISEEDIMDGACMDCRGCSAGALYFCAVQAAELRARLKAYENTGLSPEVCANYKKFEDEAIGKNVTFNRIVELMNAEAEGRLIVPLVKVGDAIYLPNKWLNVVIEFQIESIQIYQDKVIFIDDCLGEYEISDFGKTVFPTREAAEAALKEAQQG